MASFNAESKYVSLIYEASNYYASWTPSRQVRLGDYGHLQDDLSFAQEGNIFDEGLANEFDIGKEEYQTDAVRKIASRHSREIKATEEVTMRHCHEDKIKLTYTISSNYGAILVMLQPTHASLTNPGRLKKLLYSSAFSDDNIVLVSECFNCRSYARLLTPGRRRSFNIQLGSALPNNLMAGKCGLSWLSNAEGGDFLSVQYDGPDQKKQAQPLFRLVGRRSRGLRRLIRPRPVIELRPPRWRCLVLGDIAFGTEVEAAVDDFKGDIAQIEDGGCSEQGDDFPVHLLLEDSILE